MPEVENYIRGPIANGRPVNFVALMRGMKVDLCRSKRSGIVQEAGVKTHVLSHLASAVDTITDIPGGAGGEALQRRDHRWNGFVGRLRWCSGATRPLISHSHQECESHVVTPTPAVALAY
jgi:hypothetical protein